MVQRSLIKAYFIISNPPFYENDLLSPSQKKNIAMHNAELNLSELISVVKKFLTATGNFAVLLPYHRIIYFEKVAAENNLFLKEKSLIKQTAKHNYIRGVLLFTHEKKTCVETELIIKKNDV